MEKQKDKTQNDKKTERRLTERCYIFIKAEKQRDSSSQLVQNEESKRDKEKDREKG